MSVILLGGKFIYDSYDLYVTKNIRKAFMLFKYSITYLAMLFCGVARRSLFFDVMMLSKKY